MNVTYQIASSGIIHELLDNEVIIANLETGVYYSIRETGVPAWQLLTAGASATAVLSVFSKHFALEGGDALQSVQALMDRFVEEGLLTAGSSSADTDCTSLELLWPAQFSAPRLEKYSEMKDLLMLDPIHEVDEQGWPHQAE